MIALYTYSMQKITRIGIVGRPDTPELKAPLTRVLAVLAAHGVAAQIDEHLAKDTGLAGLPTSQAIIPAAQIFNNVQALIAMGGDGTLISIARRAAEHDLPIIGINQGRLGFLTDIAAKEIETALPAVLSGQCNEERRALLDVSLTRDGQKTLARDLREHAVAVNDVVLSRGSAGSMIEMLVSIDGKAAYRLRADGLILSTPTGSTAYALSANGPIVHPAVSALLMVPVAPHALTYRPVVCPDTSEIHVEVIRGRDAGLHCDGQSHYMLGEGDAITVRKSTLSARLLHPLGYDYYAMLRQKLAWSETADKFHADT
jgi:NAD+ kinase